MTKKILIIDDSITANAVMAAILKEETFEVTTALTGADGIEKAVSGNFDLCIVDTLLPDTDGFEVCRAIREKLGNKVKIIVMTGQIAAVDGVKARKSGADDYCVKTKEMKSLVETVKRLL